MSLITQEAIHGREFQTYNQTLISPFYNIYSKDFTLRPFRLIAGIIHYFSPTFHYALSAAGEHFTAIAAELFLSDPKWFKGVDPTLSAIWRWHCIEEIEHQSVAYDVFQYLNGRYIYRVIAMIIITILFLIVYIKPIWKMLKHDRKQWDYRFYKRAYYYYWGKNGLCLALFKPYLRFYHIHFHPSKHNNRSLIEKWKTILSSISAKDALVKLQNHSAYDASNS